MQRGKETKETTAQSRTPLCLLRLLLRLLLVLLRRRSRELAQHCLEKEGKPQEVDDDVDRRHHSEQHREEFGPQRHEGPNGGGISDPCENQDVVQVEEVVQNTKDKKRHKKNDTVRFV